MGHQLRESFSPEVRQLTAYSFHPLGFPYSSRLSSRGRIASLLLLAGSGETTMTLMPTTLRLEVASGSEEYRIWEGAVEVRTLRSPNEQLFDAQQSTYGWRRL